MTVHEIVVTLLCLAAGVAIVVFSTAGRSRVMKSRPAFRTNLDLEQMDVYLETQKFAEGEETCRKVLREHPDDHEAQCWLATCLSGQNRLDEAMAVLLQMTVGRAQDPWVYAQLGYLFAEQGQDYMSAWALDRGLELFPHNTELLVCRSRLFLDTGDKVRALGYAQQALQDASEDAPAQVAKLLALEAMGSFDEAEAVLLSLREQEVEGYDLNLEMMFMRIRQEHYDEALELCDRELMFAPRNSVLYRTRGRIYTRTGQYEKALTQLERARELGADEETVAMESLDALCGAGRREEAYALLEDVMRRHSPVLDHFMGEQVKTEYPILTSQEDFSRFLEDGLKKAYNNSK